MRQVILISVLTLYGVHDLAGFVGYLLGGGVILGGLFAIRRVLLRQNSLDRGCLLFLKVTDDLFAFLFQDKA
jgi:hypothetical protein